MFRNYRPDIVGEILKDFVEFSEKTRAQVSYSFNRFIIWGLEM